MEELKPSVLLVRLGGIDGTNECGYQAEAGDYQGTNSDPYCWFHKAFLRGITFLRIICAACGFSLYERLAASG